jgi:hypothetical protein
MPLKELTEDLRLGDGRVKETLHRPVAAAFSGPAGETQHGHPTGHAQHCLEDATHASHIRFRKMRLYAL